MSIGKLIKGLVILFLLGLLFHPVLTVIFLVKMGGVLFAVAVIAVALKLILGVSILELLADKKDK